MPGGSSCWNSAYCSRRLESIRPWRSEPVRWWRAKKLPPRAAIVTSEIAAASRARIVRSARWLAISLQSGRWLPTPGQEPVADRAQCLDRDGPVRPQLSPEVSDVDIDHVRAR